METKVYNSGDVVEYKSRHYTIEGIRHIKRYGKYWTNTSVSAEIWVTGPRKATYHGYIYKSGKVYLLDQNGSEEISYKGNFGYDGEKGTTYALK